MQGRSKLAALRHDLRLCGHDADPQDGQPHVPDLPALPDRACALGALYVIEGSTLGGRIIARHLRRQANIPVEAFHYLEIYANQSGEMWRAVCEALDASGDSAEAAGIVRTAIAMFEAIRIWLDPVHWRMSDMRMVGATGFEPVTPTMSR